MSNQPPSAVDDPGIDVLTPSEDDDDMSQAAPSHVDAGNLTVALTGMANEFGAAAARRVNGADQLAADSQRMWSIAMTSPTVMAAHGMRVASEAGSGRTRVEANTPAGGQTAGG